MLMTEAVVMLTLPCYEVGIPTSKDGAPILTLPWALTLALPWAQALMLALPGAVAGISEEASHCGLYRNMH